MYEYSVKTENVVGIPSRFIDIEDERRVNRFLHVLLKLDYRPATYASSSSALISRPDESNNFLGQTERVVLRAEMT
jgi:hypothetical protein